MSGLKTYDKADWDLILKLPLEEVIKCMVDGNIKYVRDNWMDQTGEVAREYRNAACRHLAAHARGEVFITDPKGDVDIRHLASAATSCLIALWHEIKNEQKQAQDT